MKEILFKAKRADGKGWVEGCYTDASRICDAQIIAWENGDAVYYEVDPETLCQFTGLTDKNGNKIFEGDELLVINGSEQSKTVIYWDEKEARYLDKRDFDGDSFTLYDGFVFVEESEITSNIHDKTESK